MKIPIYQIDAFSRQPFHGNPAAVCPLEFWLEDDILQNIAAENNLSETAFLVQTDQGYDLRWFTPNLEMDLCGHATLASAYVVFQFLQPTLETISFSTASGELIVTRDGDRLAMDFPSRPPQPIATDARLSIALGCEPLEVLKSRDLMVVLDSEQRIRELEPNFEQLWALDGFAVIITAKGDEVDFVSRFFAPEAGVPEDPVTGSAHCTLIPFWAERLGKTTLHAHQLSQRGGELFCEHLGDRVKISGHCALFLTGEITL